ncbi:molecular chaperone HscC [Rhizobium sp. RM]|uniref:molecular chaperone HscC n=1 Tax=Rhizobium sp. RM TaxID=2748079 RepID=UPI00110D515F|nr:molecular chaperone HscC [Rhizobium sp. RM]NWJ25528.1 molecular chaperone HscC [Rhizobium sp. RM]TMV22157.1 molecular chaperone HscC [Rhizobium sp. Td3]
MARVGIDLGTSNSLISYWNGDSAKLIPNALGDYLTPSAVSMADDGAIIVGQPALDRLITHPERSVASFKRWMGTDHQVKLKGKQWRAEELSAIILKSLKEDAEAFLNEKVTDVVISVPAYFSDPQRKATLNAAHLAGLNVSRLINEPTAAALAHGLEATAEGQFLVLDLGGGTFDVSLLHKFDGVMEICASSGDSLLGGNDFRDALSRFILAKHKLAFESLQSAEKQRILKEATALKKVLTDRAECEYRIEWRQTLLEGRLMRQEVEEVWQPLISRLRKPIERVIRDAGVSTSSIDQIVLVGGASRMPLVRNLVTRLFGRFPLIHPKPDHAIAIGAAIQAALHARDGALDEIIMTDVCPFTLGISAKNAAYTLEEAVMSPIIERNATVPQSREQFYSTVHERQQKIDVAVYQGENLRPSQNILIGRIEVPVPPDKAGHQSIGVRFTYDVNGALEVEVRVMSTGEAHRKVFNNQSGLSEAELERRFAELANIKTAPRDQQENIAIIARAERLYAEHIGESRDEISAILMEFLSSLNSQTLRDVDQLRASFTQKLNAFETGWNSPL